MSGQKVTCGAFGLHVAANVRRHRGWMPARVLAERLAEMGRPMHVSKISKIERGYCQINIDDLFALAQAFGVEPADLLTEGLDWGPHGPR